MSLVRTVWPSTLGAALLLLCAGCTVSATCDPDAHANEVRVASSSLSGKGELTQKGDSLALDFRARLSGLPELSPAGGSVEFSGVYLSLALRYAEAPVGGDGRTEMPRVEIKFDDDWRSTVTSSFPQPSTSASTDPFHDCASNTNDICCPLGAPECERPVHVALTRVDGAPFPPLELSWSAGADATLSNCPGPLASPSMSFTSEAP